MVDFSKYKLSINEAKDVIDSFDNMNDSDFNRQIERWAKFDVSDTEYSNVFKDIRSEIIETFKAVMQKNENKINYSLDLQVGLKLFECLNPQTGFDIIKASDDDIWRYITIKVMPDITFIRYPNLPADVEQLKQYFPGLAYAGGITTEKDSGRLKKKRFYSHTRRIWLKTLWWYIYLSWQGDYESTFKVLKNNTTNIISHFIERPGRGYRESLFRSMMYAYSMLPEQNNKIFTSAAKLNLAKCVSVEPALTEGGEIEYSKKLFEEVTGMPRIDPEKNNTGESNNKRVGKKVRVHKTAERP